MITDYHHDNIYPRAEQSLEELMPRILATWEKKYVKDRMFNFRLNSVDHLQRHKTKVSFERGAPWRRFYHGTQSAFG